MKANFYIPNSFLNVAVYTIIIKQIRTAAVPLEYNNTYGIVITVQQQLFTNSLTNVYIVAGTSNSSSLADGKYALYEGSCLESSTETTISSYERPITEFSISSNAPNLPARLSWRVSSSMQHYELQGLNDNSDKNATVSSVTRCLYLKNEAGTLMAKSEPYTVHPEHHSGKHGYSEFDHMYFNAVDFHKSRKDAECVYASDKDKKIGIIGAGISGLFSAYLLDEAGFHNYEILEATDRIGGRIHTAYFDESGHAYQEMGAMRLPVEIQYDNETLPITDTKLIFRVAEELNSRNNDFDQIKFIPWYQHRPNNLYFKSGFRLPNGRIPTIGEIQADSNLTVDSGVTSLEKEVLNATSFFTSHEWFELMSKDLHAAHRKAIDEGYDDWSEWGWLHNKLGLSLNATNYATGMAATQLWQWMYDAFAFSASTWRTIDGGMERLPRAFLPQLDRSKLNYNTPVSKLEYDDDTQQVIVKWMAKEEDTHGNSLYHMKGKRKYQSRSYDNVIVSVPFSVLRTWHLPSGLDYILREAIQNLAYIHGCKVALEFGQRFWEHYERPIEGGCDDTDLLSETTCYPINHIGHSGPGVVLASYVEGDMAITLGGLTEQQHVERVLEDFTTLHGENVQKYYTGHYKRKCYSLESYQSGTYCLPFPGQHKLYMPSYFKIDHGLIFVGEHTDIKHGWISAALESAIRGVVMLLVEYGHITEAKEILAKYNITSINI